MRSVSTRKLCAAGLLLAMGILLPQVFHLIGGAATGGTFLPMHIPLLMSGLLLGPAYGAALGIVCPAVSFLLTSMPPAAKLPFMVVELAFYGLVAGLFAARGTSRTGTYVGLIAAQAAGRLANAAALLIAARLFQLEVPAVATVGAALVTGIPGIVIQLIFIPPIVILLRKVIRFDRDVTVG